MSQLPDPFRPAVRERIKARIALIGPSKSGKTLSAIGIARGIVGPTGKIAVVDTDNDSAKLYANLTDFKSAKLGEPFHPERYCKLIANVAAWGYDAIVIDSITPAWNGPGGVMTIVDDAKRRANSTGWDEGNRQYQKLVQAVLHCPAHIICTIRAKQKHDYSKDDDGKMKVTKLGLGPEMRDGFDYEFTIVGNLQVDHSLALEARGDLVGRVLAPAEGYAEAFKSYVSLGQEVGAWLGVGAAPADSSPDPAPADGTAPAAAAEGASAAPAAAAEPEPAPEPTPAPVAAQDDLLGGDVPANGQGPMTNDQRTAIAAKLAECITLRPDGGGTPWDERINQKARDMYGADSWEALTGEQAQKMAEVLETTILRLREQAAAA